MAFYINQTSTGSDRVRLLLDIDGSYHIDAYFEGYAHGWQFQLGNTCGWAGSPRAQIISCHSAYSLNNCTYTQNSTYDYSFVNNNSNGLGSSTPFVMQRSHNLLSGDAKTLTLNIAPNWQSTESGNIVFWDQYPSSSSNNTLPPTSTLPPPSGGFSGIRWRRLVTFKILDTQCDPTELTVEAAIYNILNPGFINQGVPIWNQAHWDATEGVLSDFNLDHLTTFTNLIGGSGYTGNIYDVDTTEGDSAKGDSVNWSTSGANVSSEIAGAFGSSFVPAATHSNEIFGGFGSGNSQDEETGLDDAELDTATIATVVSALTPLIPTITSDIILASAVPTVSHIQRDESPGVVVSLQPLPDVIQASGPTGCQVEFSATAVTESPSIFFRGLLTSVQSGLGHIAPELRVGVSDSVQDWEVYGVDDIKIIPLIDPLLNPTREDWKVHILNSLIAEFGEGSWTSSSSENPHYIVFNYVGGTACSEVMWTITPGNPPESLIANLQDDALTLALASWEETILKNFIGDDGLGYIGYSDFLADGSNSVTAPIGQRVNPDNLPYYDSGVVNYCYAANWLDVRWDVKEQPVSKFSIGFAHNSYLQANTSLSDLLYMDVALDDAPEIHKLIFDATGVHDNNLRTSYSALLKSSEDLFGTECTAAQFYLTVEPKDAAEVTLPAGSSGLVTLPIAKKTLQNRIFGNTSVDTLNELPDVNRPIQYMHYFVPMLTQSADPNNDPTLYCNAIAQNATTECCKAFALTPSEGDATADAGDTHVSAIEIEVKSFAAPAANIIIQDAQNDALVFGEAVYDQVGGAGHRQVVDYSYDHDNDAATASLYGVQVLQPVLKDGNGVLLNAEIENGDPLFILTLATGIAPPVAEENPFAGYLATKAAMEGANYDGSLGYIPSLASDEGNTLAYGTNGQINNSITFEIVPLIELQDGTYAYDIVDRDYVLDPNVGDWAGGGYLWVVKAKTSGDPYVPASYPVIECCFEEDVPIPDPPTTTTTTDDCTPMPSVHFWKTPAYFGCMPYNWAPNTCLNEGVIWVGARHSENVTESNPRLQGACTVYYREPGNGKVYDLTESGTAGGVVNSGFEHLKITADGGILDDANVSVTYYDSPTDHLTVVAGSGIKFNTETSLGAGYSNTNALMIGLNFPTFTGTKYVGQSLESFMFLVDAQGAGSVDMSTAMINALSTPASGWSFTGFGNRFLALKSADSFGAATWRDVSLNHIGTGLSLAHYYEDDGEQVLGFKTVTSENSSIAISESINGTLNFEFDPTSICLTDLKDTPSDCGIEPNMVLTTQGDADCCTIQWTHKTQGINVGTGIQLIKAANQNSTDGNSIEVRTIQDGGQLFTGSEPHRCIDVDVLSTNNELALTFEGNLGGNNNESAFMDVDSSVSAVDHMEVLAWDETAGKWKPQAVAGVGGDGEINTASNLGTGEGIFHQKNGFDLQLKSILAGDSVGVVGSNETILINFDSDTVTIDELNHKVGIGTTSPIASLDISASIEDGEAQIEFGEGHADTSVRGSLGYEDTSSTSMFIANKYANSGSDDSTFGIRMKGAGAANEVVTVTGLGNVGIGTTSPSSILDLSGGISSHGQLTISEGHVDPSVSGSIGYDDTGSTTMYVANRYSDSASTFGIRMKGTAVSDEVVTILGDGKVGIGITSPAYALDIAPNIASAFRIKGSTDGSDVNCAIENIGTDANDDTLLSLTTQPDAGDPSLRFAIAGNEAWSIGIDNSDGDKLKISQSSILANNTQLTLQGNKVGIGTTSPSERLEVDGNAKVTGVVQATGGTAANNVAFNGGNNTGMYFPSQHTVRFANNGVPSVSIDTTGQVGIGINNPTEKLHIDGDAAKLKITDPNYNGGITVFTQTGTPHIQLKSHGTAASGGISFRDTADSQEWAIATNTVATTGLEFIDGANTVVMNLAHGGNVGIGTTAPSEKLEVAGNIKAGGKVTNVTDPTAAQDAATKAYVDSKVGASEGSFAIITGSGSETGYTSTDTTTTPDTKIYSATAGTRYGIDVSTYLIKYNLPSSASAGDAIFFAAAGGQFSVNQLTIVSGDPIMGSNSDMTVSVDNESFGLFFTGTEWRIY